MIYLILLSHWLADFVFQNDWMAKNKSKDNFALLVHVWIYTLIILFFAILTNWIKKAMGVPTTPHVLTFAVVNGATHFLIDYVTSRVSSKMWAKNRVHDFFVVIGFDQLLHVVILIYTFNLWIA